MAKTETEDARARPHRETTSCSAHTKCKIQPSDLSDVDPFSLVHDTDYIPPTAIPDAEEDNVPLKSRIGCASTVNINGQDLPVYVKVNGKDWPVYNRPIPSLRHLFTTEPQSAPPLPAVPNHAPVPESPTARARNAAIRSNPISAKKTSCRGTKRRASANWGEDSDTDISAVTDEDAEGDEDEDNVDVTNRVLTRSLHVNDIEALKGFYTVRFGELTMKPLRQVVTAWVKELSPKRTKYYGPYDSKSVVGNGANKNVDKSKRPPWWPDNLPYQEPSHLQRKDLIPLAVDIMLIHRRIDEESGKREKAWIKTLRRRTVNTIRDTPDENYSASKEPAFNRHMKQRALKKILPSLFSIAEAHEDYVIQYGLFEGSGNEDPGHARSMSWQKTPRPDRTHSKKRQRPTRRSTPASRKEPEARDSGDETEVDEFMSIVSSSFCSNHSGRSEEDAPISRTTGPPAEVSVGSQPPAVDHTLGRLHLSDEMDLDAKVCVNDMKPMHFSGMHPNLQYTQPGFQPHGLPNSFLGHVPYHQFSPDAGMFAHHHSIPMSMPPSQSVYGYMGMQGYNGFPYGPDQSSFDSVAPGATLLSPDHPIHGLPMNFHG